MALLEDGWWLTCASCEQHVMLDGEDNNDEPFDPVVGGDLVFCRQSCKDAEDARVAHRAAEKEHAIAETERMFPCWPGDRPCPGSQWVPCVTFTFPGGARPVTWYVGDETLRASKVDESAWLTYIEPIWAAHKSQADASPQNVQSCGAFCGEEDRREPAPGAEFGGVDEN